MQHSLKGYRILEQLYDSPKTLVYRAQRISDQQSVIIKALRNPYPTTSELAQLRHQYAILQHLNIPGVIQAYGVEKYHNAFAIILEDYGGISLSQYIQTDLHAKPKFCHNLTPEKVDPCLSLSTFFTIAGQLATILDELYHHQIVHKDIKPDNILIHPVTLEIKLIDFSISTRLIRETQEPLPPKILEGTLAYLSPEQTGRMNRGVDYRTDFYSLGVNFYKLLTGWLPFQSHDPLELIHEHMARIPVPPHQLNGEIPLALSQLILKLMAKMPEDRYQTALGLQSDLIQCQLLWQDGHLSHPLELGRQDISDRFMIPEKLYGRAHEIETLMSAFDRVAQGGTELIFVSGPSGMGKTLVVQEIRKPIAKRQGYYISGKFEQFQRNSPFSALVDAFRSLIQQLLTESQSKLDQWETKLLSVLGENGQVLVDVIPELELLIGSQPPATKLEPISSQNRFNYLFQNFIQTFPQITHPVVLFLDDLQWADSASLQFIQSLITQANIPYLLIIGAYRSEEVISAHPLHLMMKEVRKVETRTAFSQIVLNPLQSDDLNQLIVDTLNCSKTSAQQLTQWVYDITQGNPFFSTQLLKSFYQDELITFNWEKQSWEWDWIELQMRSPTKDIVKFVALQVQKLSSTAQKLLQVAACQGYIFSDECLEHVLRMPLIEVKTGLWEALQADLIVSNHSLYELDQVQGILLDSSAMLSEEDSFSFLKMSPDHCSYSFVHDRIQQAAYSLIPDKYKKILHYRIGHYFLSTLSDKEQEENCFVIVNQLNCSRDSVSDAIERAQLARLNYHAGYKAKSATAYRDALTYFMAGIQLRDLNDWQTEYQLTLDLYHGASESALLIGDYTQMEALAQTIEIQSQSLLDKVKSAQVRLEAYKAQGNVLKAIMTGLSALHQLGVPLPEQPTLADFQSAFHQMQSQLVDKALNDIAALPIMTDSKQLVIVDFLGRLLPITYSFNPFLFSIIIIKIVSLSLEYGNCPISAWGGYISYGVAIWIATQDLNAVYEMGELGLELGHRFGLKEHLTKVDFVFNYFIYFWKKYTKDTLAPLLNNYSLSIEVGDHLQASYSLVAYTEHSLWCGKSLPLLEQELSQYHESIVKLNQELSLRFYEICWQLVLNLLDDDQDAQKATVLQGNIIDESIILPQFQKSENRQAIFLLYLSKTYLGYLFYDYTENLKNIEIAEIYLDSVSSRVIVVVFYVYRLLSLLAVYPEKGEAEQICLLEVISQQGAQLQKWAESAPMNFLHQYYLVLAEWHRVFDQPIEAMMAYDQAIELAKEHEYLNDEALAKELAAVFYLKWGRTAIAQTYMIDAYYAYERWGAKAKLRDLLKRYPDLLALVQNHEPQINFSGQITYSEDTSIRGIPSPLDWLSVMRASQVLSQEIDLNTLLGKIMEVVVENAGAEQGALLLKEHGELSLKARCDRHGCDLLSGQTPTALQLPMSVIYFADRTRQPLILENAAKDSTFALDSYIAQQQPKSLLCVPIQRQKELVGILYLENNLTTGAFTTDRLEVLQLLAAQAAISLENAQLYASVEQKVKKRTAELEAAKQEAELAQEAAEKANQAKSEFLASMSHELRTPLNAVLGFSQLLYRDPSTVPEHRETLGIINRSGEHLLSLINDVLTMSKIEAGRTTLNENHFDLHALVESIHAMLLLKANAKNLKFDYDCAPDLPQYLQTDEGKLRQVLINLVGNAIKFTQKGSVWLRVKQNQAWFDDSSKEMVLIQFDIQDTGPGIAPHELNHLFKAFAQTESGRKSQEGTGLGLSISKTFVELMGGRIEIQSALGEGSCFQFEIKAHLLERLAVSSKPLGSVIGLAPNQPTYRILVVEDRWENQQVLLQLLQSVGFEVQLAANGQEAIALWQNYNPHLICMDLQMPVLDGYEATRQIKQQAEQQQVTPPIIFAITANNIEETHPDTLEIGFDDFICKPFQAEDLFAAIGTHLGVQYRYDQLSFSPAASPQPNPETQQTFLRPEDLQSLPSEWLQQVYEAASALDEPRLMGLITQIDGEYPAIAYSLMILMDNFQFDQLVQLSTPSAGLAN